MDYGRWKIMDDEEKKKAVHPQKEKILPALVVGSYKKEAGNGGN